MTNIILCGGTGTRLWPLSRSLMPKQFIKLFNNDSLFKMCINRNINFCENMVVVSNAEQYFLAKDQVAEIKHNNNFGFILEPVAKNTAPAITLACMGLDKNEIVLVSPSDHLIKDLEAYENALNEGKALAEQGYLVTFGIKPTHAETGYGYIKTSKEDVNKVEGFYEKPNEEMAKKYFENDIYYWNSGMFMFKVGTLLDEMLLHANDIYKQCKNAYLNAKKDNGITRISTEYMQKIASESIDYALMEKSEKIKMVPCDMGWSDLGSFEALGNEFQEDESGNKANANYKQIDSKNNFIYSESDKKIISTIDVEDLVVIDTKDALLISKNGSSKKVKEVVNELIENNDKHSVCNTTYKPWGNNIELGDGKNFKLKTLVINPSKRLPLQKHFHRNEHWVIVSGTATVTIENEMMLVRSNESIYVKMGQSYRIANDGKVPLVLVEVQVGEYTGEDDVVKIEDDYELYK